MEAGLRAFAVIPCPSRYRENMVYVADVGRKGTGIL